MFWCLTFMAYHQRLVIHTVWTTTTTTHHTTHTTTHTHTRTRTHTHTHSNLTLLSPPPLPPSSSPSPFFPSHPSPHPPHPLSFLFPSSSLPHTSLPRALTKVVSLRRAQLTWRLITKFRGYDLWRAQLLRFAVGCSRYNTVSKQQMQPHKQKSTENESCKGSVPQVHKETDAPDTRG